MAVVILFDPLLLTLNNVCVTRRGPRQTKQILYQFNSGLKSPKWFFTQGKKKREF